MRAHTADEDPIHESHLVSAERDEIAVLAAREGRPYDAAILDMELEQASGLLLAAEIKADPATRSIPVLALTAHAMKTDHDRAMASGCDDFATKPIEFTVLLEKINRALGAGSAPRK